MVIHTKPSLNRVRFTALYIAAMMALIPLFNLNVMGVGFFLILGTGLIVMTPFLAHDLKLNRLMCWYCLFSLYDLITFLWAPGNLDTFQYIKLIVFFLLITTIVFSAIEIRMVLLFQLIMGIIVAIILCTTSTTMVAQGEYLTDTKRAVLRIGGQLIDPNYAAMLMFPVFIYSIKVLLSDRKIYIRVFFAVFLILCIYALLRSGTRGGLLAALSGAVFYFLNGKTGIVKRIGIVLLSLILLVFLFPYLFELLPDSVQRRFSMDLLISSGGAGRSDLWKACIAGISDSPITMIFGHGKGATITNLGMASHNFVLDQLYNGGVVELALLILFIGSLYFQARRNDNTYAKSLIVAYGMMMMTVSVGANMYFWTGMALIVLLARWNETELDQC